MQEFRTYYLSPVGTIEIVGTPDGISALNFVETEGEGDSEIPDCLRTCFQQLDEYFSGKRRHFTVTLALAGTDFQKAVWGQLEQIPYGKVVSYRDVARSIGKPAASRAVGNANGTNPIPIIIPCHRVIGSDGSLAGYSSGVWRKEWLLNHEGAMPTGGSE